MSKQVKDKCAQCGKEISNPLLRVQAVARMKGFMGLWVSRQKISVLYCSKECAINHFPKVCPEI